MQRFTRLVFLGAVAAASSPLAFATVITSGGPTVAAAPVTVTNDGVLASISGSLTAHTFTGSYSEYVISDGSNPFNGSCGAGNCLTFLITASNNASSTNAIEAISNGDGGTGFNDYMLNAGYLGAAGEDGTQAPLTVGETILGTVEFNFTGSDALLPGSGTQYLVIQTNAANYMPGLIGVIDSSTDTEDGFVPAVVTPEPNSLILLGTGLFGGAALTLRRRRTSASVRVG